MDRRPLLIHKDREYADSDFDLTLREWLNVIGSGAVLLVVMVGVLFVLSVQ